MIISVGDVCVCLYLIVLLETVSGKDEFGEH